MALWTQQVVVECVLRVKLDNVGGKRNRSLFYAKQGLSGYDKA